MNNQPPRWIEWCFASSILIGAFLVFQVQPVISKIILPWFGGTPAVWTTCMLFFQVLLFCGYLYAHLSVKYLNPTLQGVVHALLVIAAVSLLPIMPADSWKPADSAYPTARILALLLVNVGLPYFLLSSTAPLIQSWFGQTFKGKSPYRLYALSNAGSLAALLSYPIFFEPSMGVQSQSGLWTIGFCVFALFCGLTALFLRSQQLVEEKSPQEVSSTKAPTANEYLAWLLLPAFASVMLLATTNQICQDVAVIPFLWIAPLSLYLVTFIICFDSPKWFSARWYSVGAIASVLFIAGTKLFDFTNLNIIVEVGMYLSAMFCICMLCHGEMVRRKPSPKYLTSFFLMTSAGGAFGGILVAIACPIAFNSFFEMNIGIVLGYVLAVAMLLAATWKTWFSANRMLKPVGIVLSFIGLLLVARSQFNNSKPGVYVSERNFYGVLSVSEFGKTGQEDHARLLNYGRISHGYQFMSDEKRTMPTSYFTPESGVGITLSSLPKDKPNRVGVIGLGIGTLAAYGRENDYYRFYEINPHVCEFADDHFTYMQDCKAEVDVILGDARLSMEQEPPQQFDVLVLDAFSGDAIPGHLLTAEAIKVYKKHLKPDGVLAMHISNRHIDLVPVVRGLAKNENLIAVEITHKPDANDSVAMESLWYLLTDNQEFAELDAIKNAASVQSNSVKPVLWTDGYSNLISLLK